MRSVLFAILFLGYMKISFADPYPLYVRYLPYTPPNLHLNTARATTAYYLPSLNQGVTYSFNQAPVTNPIRFASGPVPMRMAVYRVVAGCSGAKTVQVVLRFNIGGVFVTAATTTQAINVPSVGGIVPVFDINGLILTQQYQLQAGDFVQLQITPTNGGNLCLVNEYPTGGTDQDATHIVLQKAPLLNVIKSSTVISDPVRGTTNPLRIPGARVRYTVTVNNQANNSATAEAVTISDQIPANTTYVAGTIIIGGVTQTDAVDGDNGEFQAGSVTMRFGDLAPGASANGTFDVTID